MNIKKYALFVPFMINCSQSGYKAETHEVYEFSPLRIISYYDVHKSNEKPDGKLDVICITYHENGEFDEYCKVILDEPKPEFPLVCNYEKNCNYDEISRDSEEAKIYQKKYEMELRDKAASAI